jgi:hypothetical protein
MLDSRRVNGVNPDKDPQFKDFCQGRALVLQGFGATTMVEPMQVLSTYRFTTPTLKGRNQSRHIVLYRCGDSHFVLVLVVVLELSQNCIQF